MSTTSRRRSSRYTSRIANTIYSAVLLAMLYDWPFLIYQHVGHGMAQSTARERFIASEVREDAARLQLRIEPTFVVGRVPASAGAFSGKAVIIVSPAMLDPAKFSDNEVRFILAHEIGHLARLDAYRFWPRWTERAAEIREEDADRIGVGLVGCQAMEETIARFWGEFLKGYQEEGDHHPYPGKRLQQACPDHSMAAHGPAMLAARSDHLHAALPSYDAVSGFLPRPTAISRAPVRIASLTALKDSNKGAALPTLTIYGLTASGAFTGESLTFRLDDPRTLALARDSDATVLGPNKVRIALKPYWVFHQEDNSFTISDGMLRQLIDKLPKGPLDIAVNFVSTDGEFAAVFELPVVRQPNAVTAR